MVIYRCRIFIFSCNILYGFDGKEWTSMRNNKQTSTKDEKEIEDLILETTHMVEAFEVSHQKYKFDDFKKDIEDLDEIAHNIISISKLEKGKFGESSIFQAKVKKLSAFKKECVRYKKDGEISIFSWNGLPREDRQEIHYRIIVKKYKSLIDTCMYELNKIL